MKKLFLQTILFTSLIIGASSCSKDTAEEIKTITPNTPSLTAEFKCKIDGVDFIADSSRLNLYSGGFSIIAFKQNATAFEINLETPAVRTHTLTPNSTEQAAYVSGQNVYVSKGGSIIITTLDSVTNTATGAFSFVALGLSDSTTKTITAGIFTIK